MKKVIDLGRCEYINILPEIGFPTDCECGERERILGKYKKDINKILRPLVYYDK